MSLFESGVIEIGAFKLRYQTEGMGPSALVIGSALFYSRSFSKNLREHLRLTFIDWRGFSEPLLDENNDQVTLDKLLDDIELIRQKLEIQSCIVIGHSAHALLALEYAKKYPKCVSHVSMIGISPNLSHKHSMEAERNWHESACTMRKAALEERIRKLPDEELAKLPPGIRFVKWYIRRDPQAFYDYNFDSSTLWEGVLPNMKMFDFLYGYALKSIDITKNLESFNKPLFLGLGRYDFIVAPPSSWDSIRQKFKNLTFRVFEKSGHSPQFEEAELFDDELLKWLKRPSS